MLCSFLDAASQGDGVGLSLPPLRTRMDPAWARPSAGQETSGPGRGAKGVPQVQKPVLEPAQKGRVGGAAGGWPTRRMVLPSSIDSPATQLVKLRTYLDLFEHVGARSLLRA